MAYTPICDMLQDYTAQNPLRMHMPGHKGKSLPHPALSAIAPLDVTEITPTGDLFSGGDAIEAGEKLWAEVFHMPHCLFLTGGSTQGILSALTLACPPNSAILMDRGSHRSVYNGLALLDLHPHYLTRPWLEGASVYGAVDPHEVEKHLQNNPEIKTICITSPTYYGVLSDIPAIATVAHAHGATLVVDGAHGAHLPFLGIDHYSAADLVVVSAHKTLPALGQSALLFGGDAFPLSALRSAASIYGSSSPSYPIMASLDCARGYLLEEGGDKYRATLSHVAKLRESFHSLVEKDAVLDPCRLVICCEDGFGVAKKLEDMGIYPEMADCAHVVIILTCADDEDDVARLKTALTALVPKLGERPSCPALLPPPPEVVLTPRKAMFSPRETLPLCQCVGRIAATLVAPYPPGVPVITFGEEITKKTVSYLEGIRYNIIEEIEVVQESQVC